MTGPAFRLVDSETTDDGWICHLEALDPNPCCEGHFPAEPIVPGVAQLGLAVDLLHAVTGHPHRLTAVRSLKLRRLLRPGDTVQVRIGRPSENGSVRFEMSCGGDRVSQGALEATPWLSSMPENPLRPVSTDSTRE